MKLTKIIKFLAITTIAFNSAFGDKITITRISDATPQASNAPSALATGLQKLASQQENNDFVKYDPDKNEIRISIKGLKTDKNAAANIPTLMQDPLLKAIMEKYKYYINYDEKTDELVFSKPIGVIINTIADVAGTALFTLMAIVAIVCVIGNCINRKFDYALTATAVALILGFIAYKIVKKTIKENKGNLRLNPQGFHKYSGLLFTSDFDLTWEEFAKLPDATILFKSFEAWGQGIPMDVKDAQMLIQRYFEKYSHTSVSQA